MNRASCNKGRAGSLTVVGSGISLAGQMTFDGRKAIEQAERVFYAVPDTPTAVWLKTLNPAATSLADTYRPGRLRRHTYREMTARICSAVQEGHRVCAVFYGHPGVLAQAPHAAIRRLRRLGYPAVMLPGVSAEACLYADLGLNPGDCGCQSFDATDFLCFRRRFDPTSGLILWQIGVLGEAGSGVRSPARPERLLTLAQRLLRSYPPLHRVVVYVASTLPTQRPYIRRIRLDRLARTRLVVPMTLYVPPLPSRTPDRRVVRWLLSTPIP